MLRTLLAVACLLVLGAPSLAQPATTQASAYTDLVDLDLTHVSLDQAVNFLRERTGRNIVLSRSPGVPSDQPSIEHLQLRQVTADAALEVLSKVLPGVSVDQAGGEVIVVHADPDNGSLYSNGRPGYVAPTVRVYNLQSLVADKRFKLDDVLSLIQFALSEEGGEQPHLQIHPPTSMLIVKGSESQQRIVQAAVDALGKSVDEATAENLSKAQAKAESLQSQLNAIRMKSMGFEPPAGPATQP